MLTTIFNDLRYAFRSLLKHRNFTVAALLTLALGIGLNTSIFTLLYSVAVRELPVKDPGSVVNVYQSFTGDVSREVEGNVALLSYPEYLNYRDRVKGVSGLAASSDLSLYLGGNNVDKVSGLLVTDNYFPLLGGAGTIGRTFGENECQVELQCPYVVLSNGFWQKRFGADQNIVGTSIILNRQHFTVIGVAATDFHGAEMNVPDVWIPVTMQPALRPDRKLLASPDTSWLTVIGRLRGGVSLRQLQAEMQLVASQRDQEYHGRKSTVSVMAGSYLNSPEVRSEGLPIALLVMVGVGLVLLVVCANVSNLMLARSATRRKEIAVRLALGASRWRLVRLLLAESILLALFGGLAGLLLSVGLPSILMSAIPEIGLDINLKPNLTVFSYMFLISLVTGIVFGLAPAIQSTKHDLSEALKSKRSETRGSRSRLRSALVISQIAVSLVLLIGAGLVVRGLQQAQSTDLGFDIKNLLVLSMDLSAQGYDEARATSLNMQLAERLKSLPEIKSLSVAELAPFAGRRDENVEIEGAGAGLSVSANAVNAGYFQTVGMSVRRGRAFTEEDARSGASPVVISEAMAHRFWSNNEPIGQRFKDSSGTTHEIIGVVSDISSTRVGKLDGPMFYTPVSISNATSRTFLLRTNGNDGAAVIASREAARLLDKDAFVSVEPLENNVRRMLEPARTSAWFSSTVSLLALIIAATGIYGMLSYHVVERTSEIGIRMALGATRRNVLLLIVRDGMKLAAIGTAIGVLSAVLLSKALSSVLFGLASTDVVTYATVACGALVVALLACYIPARRATTVDPLVALRKE
jgi:predicted permease